MSDETLRSHYTWQHLVNENNSYFQDLFVPDTNLKRCDICLMDFKNSRIKKNHMFLLHYNQTGGSRMNQQLPVNVLRRGPVKYFSINYQQHKNDFFQESVTDDFLQAVYNNFVSNNEYKIQGYAEITNQQQEDFIVSESTRVWLTNTFTTHHFNPYVRGSIKIEILKRVIVNGMTGSSWCFKRFQRLTIIMTSVKYFQTITSG